MSRAPSPSPSSLLPPPVSSSSARRSSHSHRSKSDTSFPVASSSEHYAPAIINVFETNNSPTIETAGTSGSKAKKTATFQPLPKRTRMPVRVHWANLKRIIGTASAPSESLLDVTVESTEASSFRAAIAARHGRENAEFGITTRERGEGEELQLSNGVVDEVVVDTDWEASRIGYIGSVAGQSDPSAPGTNPNANPYTHGNFHNPIHSHTGYSADNRSQAGFTQNPSEGAASLWGLGTFVRWRIWPACWRFFDLGFWNASQEERYRKDAWYTSKQLAILAALFYLLNAILTGALVPKPFSLMDQIEYYGVAPALNIPILICVLFNVPRYRARTQLPYQILLLVAAWSWAWFNIFDMWSCGFYLSITHPACGQKDFQLTSYFSSALPTIALFALGQSRIFALLGALAYSVLIGILILPIRSSWARNFINVLMYQLFIIYISYAKEQAERRLFIMRDQLKDQFKATQKAQVNERKEGDSKKRFVSYIFHEVRVPLNTALLASQNLVGSKAVSKDDDIEFSALEGSLKMMSKVLNDVLDFNRMDSGRFVTVSRPYCFHNAIRSMLMPLALTARSRGLELTTVLDPRIDEAANRAAYLDEYEDNADREGMVLGDDMRLRQLVTNLTSNACKFTGEGGKIHVETRLIFPAPPSEGGPLPTPLRTLSQNSGLGIGGEKASGVKRELSRSGASEREREKEKEKERDNSADRILTTKRLEKLDRHNLTSGHASVPLMPLAGDSDLASGRHSRREQESIIVRIEVTDTGVGIRPRDLVENRLFSPYVQTEIGRYQGGKGTGLGLALVRHIVKLSGGRLGVRSKVGEGSTFWVELALGVGPDAILGGSVYDPDSSTTSSQHERKPGASSRSVKSEFEAEADRSRQEFVMSPDLPQACRVRVQSAATGVSRPTSDTSVRTVTQMDGVVAGLDPFVAVDYTVTPATPKLRPPGPTPLQHHGPPLPAPSTQLPHPLAMLPPPRSPLRDTIHPSHYLPPTVLPTPGDPAKVDTAETGSFSPLTAVLRQAGAAGPTLTTGSLPAVPLQPQQEPPLPVLVVDDDPLTRKLMARMLTRIGCTVDLAENGQVALDTLVGSGAYAEAISRYGAPSSSNLPTPATDVSEPMLIDEHKYGVVFLDNQMPLYTGVQVVARLRELARDTFVVGVTGNALKEDQEEYLGAGVDRILTKPVLEKDLRNMVTLADELRRRRDTSRTDHTLPQS